MKKIAITGGIASGKSTVCRILKQHGAYQLSSDEIIHQLLSEDKQTIYQVTNLLGSKILVDGKIDRRKIAQVVFSNSQKLKALENILHPKLLRIIEERYVQAKQAKAHKLFVVEMALVQEISKTQDFDAIIVIVCNEDEAKRRSPLPEEEYTRRMKRQWPIEKKAKYASHIIENNGSITELEKNTLDLIETLNP